MKSILAYCFLIFTCSNAFAQTYTKVYFTCRGTGVDINGLGFTQADVDNDPKALWTRADGIQPPERLTLSEDCKKNNCIDPRRCANPRAVPIVTTIYRIRVNGQNYSVKVFVAEKFVVSPQNSDFLSGKEGCIFTTSRADITSRMDNGEMKDVPRYYSSLQTQDRRVRVKAVLEPAQDFVGQAVVFRSIDPADKSRYEHDCQTMCEAHPNRCSNDNLDPLIGAGKFVSIDNPNSFNNLSDIGTAQARLGTATDGHQVAIAEIDLVITDRYQGDNYQVEATLVTNGTRNFDNKTTCVQQSVILIAWDRYYLEVDNMYKKGATIIDRIDENRDGNFEKFGIDNIDGITVGTDITFIRLDIPDLNRTIRRMTVEENVNYIYVDEIYDISRLDGFKLKSDDSYIQFNNTPSLNSLDVTLKETFGGNRIDGSDNGSFTEIITGITKGSKKIPFYKKFKYSTQGQISEVFPGLPPLAERLSATVEGYVTHWAENQSYLTTNSSDEFKNVRYLAFVNDMIQPLPHKIALGITFSLRRAAIQSYNYQYNTQTQTYYPPTPIDLIFRLKVCSHEVGHLLGLFKTPNTPNQSQNVHVDRGDGSEDGIGVLLACVEQVCKAIATDYCFMSYCSLSNSITPQFDAACYWRLRRDVPND